MGLRPTGPAIRDIYERLLTAQARSRASESCPWCFFVTRAHSFRGEPRPQRLVVRVLGEVVEG